MEMNDVARIRIGLNIGRCNYKPIKSCLSQFDSGAYNRFQLLLVVSHCMGAHAL